MFDHKFFLICLIGLSSYKSTLCDFDKNDTLPHQLKLSDELTKNRFDHVHINHENISTITKDLLWELESVEKLEIKSSNVKSIEEGSFNHLRSLKKLSLKHNLLEEIKNNIFSNLQIEELDLSDNQIRVIEKEAFNNMLRLTSIKLKNNKIEVYETTWFRHLPSLCNINLENNLIRYLPGETENGYTHKNCSVDLILSHNWIEKIDENAFSSFLHLGRLYLDDNAITSIENKTFIAPMRIEDLRLNHNGIVCTTADMKNVGRYDVSHNPWNQKCLLAFEGMNKIADGPVRFYDSSY